MQYDWYGEGIDKKKAYGIGPQRMAWPVNRFNCQTLALSLPLDVWPGMIG